MMVATASNSLRVQEPLVSVIMNCFNGEKYLREAIESVLAQTYQNWEIIFWDNQSTDRSAEIFRSYCDPRLRYFYAPTHGLLYESRNYAIQRAGGDFYAFLDVDDWWFPQKLRNQIPLFGDPEVGFVCSNYWIVNEQRKTRKLFRRRALPSGWVLNDLLVDYSVGLLTLVVRRKAFEGLRIGCDPRYHIIGDIDLLVRLAVDWKLDSCQESLACYRIHGDNEGLRGRSRQVAEYQVWVEELGRNPFIRSLPGYAKVMNEFTYMQGRLCLDENQKGAAISWIARLPWGKFKLKLLTLALIRLLSPAWVYLRAQK